MFKTLKTKLIGTTAIVTAVSSSFFAPFAARANSQYIYEVGNQLAQAAIASGLGGYTMSHEPFIDSTYDGRSDYITINLRGGVSYGIVGVCDSDCRDLDLHLYNSSGNRIDYDTQSDDTPIVTVTPYRSGTYQVRVNIANCRSSLCYYGVGVFAQ